MTLETPGGGHPGHGQGPAGASLSDLLTAVKNVAVNIANLGQTLLQIAGTATSTAMTAQGQLRVGSGRIAKVSVTAAGTAPGAIVDSNQGAATTPVIYSIPNVVGLYEVNLPYSLGLVVIPGAGQTVTVSYS